MKGWDMDSVAGVNEDELNKMIANLQGDEVPASDAPDVVDEQLEDAVADPEVNAEVQATEMAENAQTNPEEMMQATVETPEMMPSPSVAPAPIQSAYPQVPEPTPVVTPVAPVHVGHAAPTHSFTQPMAPANNLPNVAPAVVGLDAIKGQALTELRPLVDKLNLAPEDKFDILLLIIRSTDDNSLIPQAHETAKMIADESRKAQALLDIIKEIDFFDQSMQQ